MGIPHLTKNLRPYAEPVQLCDSNGLLPTTTVSSEEANDDGEGVIKPISTIVLDGPGLIYHVYYRLLACVDTHFNAIDARPSNREISLGVVRFLLMLRERGVSLQKIYFDGALPLSKRETRLQRMETTRTKLDRFCREHQGGFKSSSVTGTRIVINPSIVFNKVRNVPDRFTGLPESPFMTPATIEDLKTFWTWRRIREHIPSAGVGCEDGELPWADLVEMVPEEADIYCGEVARRSEVPIAVLTCDSDLLVHDLGPNGSVIFYDSLELCDWDPKDPGSGTVKGMEMCPAEIAERLGVVNIQRLAFEMNLDPHLRFNETIRRAKDSSGRVEKSTKYRGFLEEYRPLVMAAFESTRSHLHNPKVSELISQYDFPRCRPRAGKGRGGKPEPPHMYLPILIEDHNRRCAWTDGMDIRTIAYSHLNLNFPRILQHDTILEYARRGMRIAPTAIPLSETLADLTSQLTSLLERIRSIRALIPNHHQDQQSSLKFWTLFALLEIYQYDVINTPTPIPTQKQTLTFLSRSYTSDNLLEWGDIHRYARVQAVLYSLKMLKDLLGVSNYASVAANDLDGTEGEVLVEIKSRLKTLPPTHTLLQTRVESCAEFRSVGTGEVVAGLYALIKRDDDRHDDYGGAAEVDEGWFTPAPASMPGVGTGGKKRKKGKKGKDGPGDGDGGERGKVQRKAGKVMGNNMFDVLGMD